MDHVWTPWRFKYISSSHSESICIFCQLPAEKKDRQNLILLRREHAYVVLNRFPYTAGHLIIATHRHIATLAETTPAETGEMMLMARECERALGEVYRPDGYNLGLNIGKSAGAGVAGHLHLHVVPRWQGDGNFVSVVGETRLIPEELETTYDKLLPHFGSGIEPL